MVSLAAAMTFCAVWMPPVNDTLPTSGWRTRRSPASAVPGTTLITPGGTPASSASSAKRTDENGASSEGLSTMVLPAASAGPSLARLI